MSAPLKVLLVCQDYDSEEKFLRPWVRFLLEQDVRVAVAAPLTAREGMSLSRDGAQLYRLEWSPDRRWLQKLVSIYDFHYASMEFMPDILHSLDRFSRLMIGWAGRRLPNSLMLHSQTTRPDFKNWLLFRWTHHEVVPSGNPGPRRTIVVDGLPERVRLERFLGLYRRLWSEMGITSR